MSYQTPSTPDVAARDHVWFKPAFDTWKCCICGAITRKLPPLFPTRINWMPERYEPLLPDERRLV